MLTLDNGKDLYSDRRRSERLKTISTRRQLLVHPREELTDIEKKKKPRKSLHYACDGHCSKKVILEYAETALSSFNEINRAQQGVEYELVNPLGCVKSSLPQLYH